MSGLFTRRQAGLFAPILSEQWYKNAHYVFLVRSIQQIAHVTAMRINYLPVTEYSFEEGQILVSDQEIVCIVHYVHPVAHTTI